MIIRPYSPDDLEQLATLYYDSVVGLGPAVYNPDQVAAWASFAEDREAFRTLLEKGHTLVAEVDGAPAAFCQLHPEDHISLLYTAAQLGRKGLATEVYRRIEVYAREKGQTVLTTDASKISRPFFEKEGYTVRRAEETIRKGVSITRYQMEKRLLPVPDAPLA